MEGLTNTTILWRGGGAGGSVISGYPPAKCSNLVAKPKSSSVELTWNDPDDITIHGPVKVKWAKTVVIRKVGSCPIDENDGTVVVSSTIRNQYADNPFIDTGLTNNVTYYYAAFSCSEDGVYNREIVSASATPIPYKTMTVRIDLNNSNPVTCGSYADDAVSMSPGKNVPSWDEFFGYKPCLFKDGKVVGYLNPNDYTKFEDGRPADITSGNAGDVMVEFPRRGLKISKSGKVITVSMTDDPHSPHFKYYAHNNGSQEKNFFYVGAYLGSAHDNDGGKRVLDSISDAYPAYDTKNPDPSYKYTYIIVKDARTFAKNKGVGYRPFSFYQFLFIQCMYLLQFKGNLNSQSAHGLGFMWDGRLSPNSGTTNTKGMMYGSSSTTDHIKLFGIEDFWGNFNCMIDGYFVDSSFNVWTTTTDNFNETGSGYDNHGPVGVNSVERDYFDDAVGSTELGFTPISFNGSGSTYFCDHGTFGGLANSYFVTVGGDDNAVSGYYGIFRFDINSTISLGGTGNTCRLAYL